MIKENQPIELTIVRPNLRDYYINKGYNCKVGNRIIIEAKDISPSSHKKIKYICDYCNKEFERMPYSNERSKENNLIKKDACTSCKRKRTLETTINKYGVDNVMKVPELQQKCKQSKNNQNFNGSTFNSCSYFINGIPVSKGQDNLHKNFPEFELNYHLDKYYIDLFYNNICIEYNGRGHDLGVRMGKISTEDFNTKEQNKKDFICKNNKLLVIVDKKDKLKKEENITNDLINEIRNFIKGDDFYKELEVK